MAAYARRMFAGGSVSTTAPTGMGSADTSFTIANSSGWSDGSGGNFMVVVDFGQSTQEKILCSARSGLVVTVASSGRGYDGTSSVAHSAGCSIQQCHGAQDDDEANQVVAGVLGQSGAAKGDILSILSAAGPNTLTRVGIGTAGQLLGVSAGLPAWQYPALTIASGAIVSNVSLGVNTLTKVFDTASLAAGTWHIHGHVLGSGNAAGAIEITAAVDSATATLTGQISDGQSNATGDEVSLSVDFYAVVTIAGTIKISAESSNATGANAIAATGVTGFGNATGYTAFRLV